MLCPSLSRGFDSTGLFLYFSGPNGQRTAGAVDTSCRATQECWLGNIEAPRPEVPRPMMPLVQASSALAESLIDNPFYCSITDDFGTDLAARKQTLSLYFHYSLDEAERIGRCVVAPDPTLGAAAWLLPQSPEVDAVESSAKFEYLASVLGPRGLESYHRIVRYMAPLATRVVPRGAWYLSIIGILPSVQGRGLGAALLAGTLAEASQAHVPCYLETFSLRNLRFYERLGFCGVANHVEPTTNKEYVIMRRDG
jgi:GNAT superfamily N-acetyltransferase